MAGKLGGKTIAFLATHGVEQVELTEPWKAVEAAGGTPELISLESGQIQGFDQLDKADTFTVDHTVEEADAATYDALMLPGGVANPDFLRMNQDAVAFVHDFFEQAKPVGVICHGPWTLVEADVVRGRTITSWPSLRTDLRNAGATWVDEEVVVDEGLVSSRNPGDLPAFCGKLVEEFAEAEHEAQRRSAGAPRVSDRSDGGGRLPAAILDIDGTLVDTNYHHALAWFQAFRRLDVTLPLYRIHRHMGMGGDQLVEALAGPDFEAEHGDEVRELESGLYKELIGEVQPLADARELLEDLKRSGHAVVLASSAKRHEVEHYLDLLDARDLADDWTMSDDVEKTKPEPDLVQAAIEKAGGGPAVMVGDSVWDCEAAERAGVPTVAVLTGGFSEQELRAAGAVCVFERLVELRANIASTPLSPV